MKRIITIIGVLISIHTFGQKTFYDQTEIDFIYNLKKYTIRDVREVVKSRLDSQYYARLQDKAARFYNYILLDNRDIFTPQKFSDPAEIEKIKAKLDSGLITSISFSSDTWSSANGKLTQLTQLSTRESARSKKKYITLKLPSYGSFYCAIHTLSGQILEIVFNNDMMESAKVKNEKIKVLKDRLGGDKMLVVYSIQGVQAGKKKDIEYYFTTDVQFYTR